MTTAPLLAVGRSTGTWAAWPVAMQAAPAVVAVRAISLAAPVLGLVVPSSAATMLAIAAVALAAWPRGDSRADKIEHTAGGS